ncbi:hypothetical protein [Polymorphum gilvum]|uniref:Uncharacterized protein n=1 Tax=Polymorphum gilvum (strain LMG 25793 / CGMCC 1.9160 / SL003B-26A1) TaxID=991905 RepID=F2J1J8_POLGS|nr:hypothetical protein [Polymorphum gilvum]ADZ70799.1 hypothetical protein SL003B_2374 [Polymorphum gilvum SL003B-26A1]
MTGRNAWLGTLARGAVLVLLIGVPGRAAANSAEDIVSRWFAELATRGAGIARYGHIEAGVGDGDVRVLDGEVVFSMSLPNGEDEATVRITFDETVYEGLAETAQGYSAESVRIPGDLVVTVTFPFAPSAETGPSEGGAPKRPRTGSDPSGLADDSPDAERTMTVSFVHSDFEATSVAWPRLPELSSDPQRPVTRHFELAGAILALKAERAFAPVIEFSMEMDEGVSSNVRYEDWLIRDLADGRIAEQVVAGMEQTETAPALDGSGEPVTVTVTAGRSTLRGFDAMPILTLLGQGTDPTRLTVVHWQETRDIEMSAADVTVSVAGVAAEGVGLTRAETPQIVGYLDQAALDQGPSDDDAVQAILKLPGLLRIDRFDLDTLRVSSPQGSGAIRRMNLRRLDGDGLGEFAVEGIVGEAGDLGSLRLDRLAVADVGFPSLAAFVALGEQEGEPTMAEILKVSPLVGLFEIVGFALESAELGGRFTIDEHRVSQRGHVNRIPTDIALTTRGLRFPTAVIDDPQAQALLDGLGLEEIEIDQRLRIDWNAATGDLTLHDLSLTLRDGASARLTLTLGSVQANLFEAPETAQMALALATLKSARMRITDADLVRVFIDHQAREAGLSPDTMALGLADYLREELGPLAGTRFGEDLVAAARTFLVDPREIVVELAPAAPVPLTQVLGMAATAPAGLPDLLGARVSAR